MAAKKTSKKAAAKTAAAKKTGKKKTVAQLEAELNKRFLERERHEKARIKAFEEASPRLLNTITAVQADGKQPQPTAYAGTRVLVARSAVDQDLIDDLTEIADKLGWNLDAKDALNPKDLPGHQARHGVAKLELKMRRGAQVKKPDAWTFLQAIRASRKANVKAANIGLDHLIAIAEVTG